MSSAATFVGHGARELDRSEWSSYLDQLNRRIEREGADLEASIESRDGSYTFVRARPAASH